jgi:hypothetical protein
MRRGFGFRRHLANPNANSALQNAHEFMERGNYAEAAKAFEALAQAAEKHMGPRTPFFYLQAGSARLLLKQNALGMEHLRHGLELLAASGRYHQLYRAGMRVVNELKARGMEKEAQEISRLVHRHTPAIAESPTQRGPDPNRPMLLPTHCPSCGGPVRSDEVDWIDANSAECPFCGSPVRIEA